MDWRSPNVQVRQQASKRWKIFWSLELEGHRTWQTPDEGCAKSSRSSDLVCGVHSHTVATLSKDMKFPNDCEKLGPSGDRIVVGKAIGEFQCAPDYVVPLATCAGGRSTVRPSGMQCAFLTEPQVIDVKPVGWVRTLAMPTCLTSTVGGLKERWQSFDVLAFKLGMRSFENISVSCVSGKPDHVEGVAGGTVNFNSLAGVALVSTLALQSLFSKRGSNPLPKYWYTLPSSMGGRAMFAATGSLPSIGDLDEPSQPNPRARKDRHTKSAPSAPKPKPQTLSRSAHGGRKEPKWARGQQNGSHGSVTNEDDHGDNAKGEVNPFAECNYGEDCIVSTHYHRRKGKGTPLSGEARRWMEKQRKDGKLPPRKTPFELCALEVSECRVPGTHFHYMPGDPLPEEPSFTAMAEAQEKRRAGKSKLEGLKISGTGLPTAPVVQNVGSVGSGPKGKTSVVPPNREHSATRAQTERKVAVEKAVSVMEEKVVVRSEPASSAVNLSGSNSPLELVVSEVRPESVVKESKLNIDLDRWANAEIDVNFVDVSPYVHQASREGKSEIDVSQTYDEVMTFVEFHAPNVSPVSGVALSVEVKDYSGREVKEAPVCVSEGGLKARPSPPSMHAPGYPDHHVDCKVDPTKSYASCVLLGDPLERGVCLDYRGFWMYLTTEVPTGPAPIAPQIELQTVLYQSATKESRSFRNRVGDAIIGSLPFVHKDEFFADVKSGNQVISYYEDTVALVGRDFRFHGPWTRTHTVKPFRKSTSDARSRALHKGGFKSYAQVFIFTDLYDHLRSFSTAEGKSLQSRRSGRINPQTGQFDVLTGFPAAVRQHASSYAFIETLSKFSVKVLENTIAFYVQQRIVEELISGDRVPNTVGLDFAGGVLH